MNLVLKKISIALLLLAGMASAFAGPGQREERAAARAERQQYMRDARDAQDDQQQQTLRDADLRRARDARSVERRPNMQQPLQPNFQPNMQPNVPPNMQQQVSPGGPPEATRRNARMSPEERRALRRQIDEAGHQIYAPQR